MKLTLRHAASDEYKRIYHLMHDDMLWKETNAPYFPYEIPSLKEFRAKGFQNLCEGGRSKLIEYNSSIIGDVGYYWEYQPTRWLEVGIVIYDSRFWGKGIATEALRLFIDEIFATHDIARVGLTTWSGNKGMMRVAEKLGMKQEACIRKVRYHQGEYYDSVKYGVLREEWEMLGHVT